MNTGEQQIANLKLCFERLQALHSIKAISEFLPITKTIKRIYIDKTNSRALAKCQKRSEKKATAYQQIGFQVHDIFRVTT